MAAQGEDHRGFDVRTGIVTWGGQDRPVTQASFEEQVRTGSMSAGEYVLPADGYDDQAPHAEDEVYVVAQGRATLEVGGERFAATVGQAFFVPARANHRFVDITEDLRVMVVFCPPYAGRSAGL